jgi:hypothetical protein
MSQLTALDISTLTVAEKVTLMERLWDDISRTPNDVKVPAWQLQVLEERERALANGEDEFIDFEVAMAEIRERTKVQQNSK